MSDSQVGARNEFSLRNHLFILYSCLNSANQHESPPIDLHMYDLTKCFDEINCFFQPFFLFRCVRQERISIRGFVRRSVGPSVRPSVRPSVCPLRKCKNRVSRLFLATVRSYTETNDQPTCFESSHPSVHPFVTPYI